MITEEEHDPMGGVTSATETEFIKWLVEVLGYPFNITFPGNPPPVDHALIAAHWNEYDNWNVTIEEARQTIRDECGV
jgi:hypothetical protein